MTSAATEREATFQRGIEAYRSGHHYEAHEAWEALWEDEADEAHRQFLQALIMIASAVHKLSNDVGPRGALRLLDGALRRLEGIGDEHGGVRVAVLRDGVRRLREHAEARIAAGERGLDAAWIPAVERAAGALEWQQAPPAPTVDAHRAFHEGIAEYRRGAFYEAHEHWESIWQREPDGPQRTFLQGLIQVAAAMHKLFVMKSPSGAVRLLAKARGHLASVPAGTAGLDLAALLADIDRVKSGVEAITTAPAAVDPALVPAITAQPS